MTNALSLPRRFAWPLLVILGLLLGPTPCGADVLDDFGTPGGWTLILADGVRGEIVSEDGALRLDYDFTAGAGYCVIRRSVDLALDPNYRFGLRYRGDGPPNTLEFKLVDPSGENVWWAVRRDTAFPTDWSSWSIRRRHVSFAWGPSGGAPISKVGAIEIAVTATQGGKGSVWLEDLVYERLPDSEPQPIEPQLFDRDGRDIGRAGPDGSIDWSAKGPDTLDLVFAAPSEFSAVELDWADDGQPVVYQIEVSSDGSHFRSIGEVKGSDGGTDTLFAPETEARIVRVRVEGESVRLRSVRFVPVDRITSANDYFAMLAGRARRGAYPPSFEMLAPWTVVGLPDHPDEALMTAAGAVEPVKGGFTLEPFLIHDGRVVSWADAIVSQSLDSGSLPIPSVHWTTDGLSLDITTVVTEASGAAEALVRYRVTNTSDESVAASLVLAARPFQALPAAQFLNIVGGAVKAELLAAESGLIRVDGKPFARATPLADAVLTVEASGGDLIDELEQGGRQTAPAKSVGPFPTGAWVYDLVLEPGTSRVVFVSLPMSDNPVDTPVDWDGFEAVLIAERASWEELLGRSEILVPATALALRDSLRSNLAYILINADGPRLQPGSRTYERSWIRDGAMTSAALLAVGHPEEAKGFIDWYADYQYPNGKVPCVVDARGPDPVDENDAPGQFIFAIRNSAEAAGEFDEGFARAMYPKVRATVNYIEAMRNTRLTPEYTEAVDPIKRACAGLMPESISHEGYSAKPMHSYWDDFWVYRGLHDAAAIAHRLGETQDHARFAALADAFGASIRASIDLATSTHGVGYVPGCVELGDFDATSTAVGFYPTGAAAVLDPGLMRATFERAWEATDQRINGSAWDGMTPYEVRVVGTFVRLGWVDRAHAYMDWLIGLQAPAGWRQWGEIAYREDRPSRFVGDMPHTWVGSGAILSILSMFAYEDGEAVVLAGGVPAAWLQTGEPVGVRGRASRYGVLIYTLTQVDGTLRLDIEAGHAPAGGYRIDVGRLMGTGSAMTAEVDGVAVEISDDGVLRLPASARRVRVTR